MSTPEEEAKFEVVVSGISGRFPNSDSLQELKENLLKKLNLISDDEFRCKFGNDQLPKYHYGKISIANKFDDSFFGIPYRLANLLDPLTRVTIERAYEAVFDAGLNPADIKQSYTAVYTASSISESEAAGCENIKGSTQYWLLSHIRALLANRISYLLNLNGPSWTIDCTWSGGFECLTQAVDDIRKGRVSAALVGVTNVILFPEVTDKMSGLDKLTNENKCRPYDENAKGYVRSEGVVMLFLQRANEAKRSYGTIVHADHRFYGDTEESILRPSTPYVTDFLRKFYAESKVSTNDVVYLEADGTAEKLVDEIELNAISDVFFTERNRKEPLLIGSVKSNLGHTEAASCLVSLAKILLSLDSGIIPPHINFHKPNPNIPKLLSKELQIALEPVKVPPGKYVAVNSFGMSNSIGHVLMKQHPKEKKRNFTKIPRLVLLSARHEQGIRRLIDKLEASPYDPEYFALVNDIFKETILSHFYRGFSVLGAVEKKINFSLEVQPSITKRPVWFVFAGMGSQWPGMGADLMELPIFEKSINECHSYLEPYNINLKEIITSFDPSLLENAVHSFVGITAIQIGMVDVLRAVGIEPDGMLGHSLGENGCSYADGCFNRYQTIMAAYHRGRSSQVVSVKKGLMAAVGVGYEHLKDLPENICIACHNSDESCTISGPIDAVLEYMNELKRQNIFVRKVNSNNLAYHSYLVKPLASYLSPELKKIIPEPKKRSSRWRSTSIAEENWDSDLALTSSSEYHVNNFLSTVRFAEVCKQIPENAVVIEISPHGLFQGILKRSLHESCFNISLGKRETSSPLNYLLSSIGKLYVVGLLPDVNTLYPKVEYPVSRETPPLADFATWVHEKNWEIERIDETVAIKPLKISLCNPEYRFLVNHKVNSRIVIPASSLLFRTTEPLKVAKEDENMLVFEKVVIHSTPEIEVKDTITVNTQVTVSSGNFEILSGDRLLISGNVQYAASKTEDTAIMRNTTSEEDDEMLISFEQSEIYSIFRKNGYSFRNPFSDIRKIHFSKAGCQAEVIWKQSLPLFLNTVMQIKLFSSICRQEGNIGLPHAFLRFVINPKYFESIKSETVINVSMDINTNVIWSDNFYLTGIQNFDHQNEDGTFENDKQAVQILKFIPYSKTDNSSLDVTEFIEVCMAIVLDNTFVHSSSKNRFNIYNVHERNGNSDNYINNQVNQLLEILQTYLNRFEVEVSVYGIKNVGALKLVGTPENDSLTRHLLIFPSKSVSAEELKTITKNHQDVFLFVCFDSNDFEKDFPIVVTKSISDLRISLRKKTLYSDDIVLTVRPDKEHAWLDFLEDDLYSIKSNKTVIVHWNSKYLSEAMNHLTEIYSLGIHHKIRFVINIGDENSVPLFSSDNPLYRNQLERNLSVNVLKNNEWGTLDYLPTHLSETKVHYVDKLSESCKRILKVNVKFFTIPLYNRSIEEVEKLDETWMEYSAISENNERVMGVADIISVHDENSVVEPLLQWSIPSTWSLEDAATVPLSYSKVYYALLVRGKLRPHSKVLVHSGHTDLGEAAIAISLSLNCEVFTTTVDDARQIETIKTRFSNSKLLHVLILDDGHISSELLKLTEGYGVDIIINPSNEEQIRESLKCIALFGSIIQLDNCDVNIVSSIGMETFLKNVDFIGCTKLDKLKFRPDLRSELHRLILSGIKDGIIRPFNKVIYRYNTKETAFRSLGTSHNFYKTVISRSAENEYSSEKKSGSYLIIGDKCSLWYDVIFYSLKRRNANQLVFAMNEQTDDHYQYTKQFDLLVQQKNVFVTYLSLDTLPEYFSSASENNQLVDAIFFINQKKERIRDVSLLLEQYKTKTERFICLQSDGSQVCEYRYDNSLPSYNIGWSEHIEEPPTAVINDILSTISASSNVAPVIRISRTDFTDVKSSKNELIQYLPDVSVLNDTVEYLSETQTIYFERACSLCPENYKKSQLFPVFLIPGIHWTSLKQLVHKLMHPVFCANFPTLISTLTDAASVLVELMKEIQPNGPYTIIGETWSGAIAMEVMSVLEKTENKVTLILLEAIPLDVTKKFRKLTQLTEQQLSASVFDDYSMVAVDGKEEHLVVDNERLKTDVDFISKVISNRLSIVQQHDPSRIYFYGNVMAIKSSDLSILNTLENFEKAYSQQLDLYVLDKPDYNALLCSSETVNIINENVLFNW